MASNRDVSLVIKAKNEASRAIDAVADALKALGDIQDDAAGSGAKINSVVGELGRELANLNNQTKGLTALGAIAVQMDKAAAAVTRLDAEVAKTTVELEDLGQASAKTKAQTTSLTSDLDRQTKALRDQEKATKDANEARKNANRELGKAETQLGRLEARAGKLGVPDAKLSAQIAEQRELVSNLRATQQAAITKYEAEKQKQKEVSAGLKDLNAQLGASKAAEGALASALENATVKLGKQNEAVSVAKTGLSDISAIAGRASAALGGVEVSQEGVAAASKSAAEEIAKVSAALARQAGAADPASAAGRARGGAVQSATASTGIVRTLREQVGATRSAEIAWRQAQAEANKLGAAMRATEKPSAEMQRAFLLAREASKSAKKEFLAQGEALGRLRNSAGSFKSFSTGVTAAQREAAQATAEATAKARDLDHQNRLAANSLRMIAPQAQAAGAGMRGAAAAGNGLRDAFRGIYGESRQAMSMMQRLRGEVLSLASAYIGLQAGLRQVGGVVTAFQTLEAAQNRLGAVFEQNDVKVRQELSFVRQEADRLKLAFGPLADEYSKFAIAAKQANFSNEATRQIFTSVAEAARVNRLSVEQTSGVFLALTQMVNKGKISAEELRRQMGERLPGAVNIFADAIGVSTAQLDKMMDKGEVLANQSNLLKFAEEMQRRFGPQLAKSLEGITAEVGALQNNVFGAQLQVGEGGFIKALEEALKNLNAFFDSAEGEEFFNGLGLALGRLVMVLAEVPQYFSEIQTAIGVFLAVKLGTSVLDLAVSFGASAKAVRSLSDEMAFVGPRMVQMSQTQRILGQGFAQVIGSIDTYRASLLASTSSTTTARAGVMALNATLGVVRTTMITVASVARGLWAAIGGLPGIILSGLTYAVGSWLTNIDSATTALETHQNQLRKIVEGYADADKKAGDWANKINGVTLSQALKNVEDLRAQYDKLFGSLASNSRILAYGFGDFPAQSPQGAQLRELLKAVDDARSGIISLDALVGVLDRIALTAADPQFRDVALEMQRILQTSTDTEPSLLDLADAIAKAEAKARLIEGTATDADKALLGLGNATSALASNTQIASDAYDRLEEALAVMAKFIPGLADKMKEMKRYQEVDDAFLKGMAAIGEMGMKSAAGVDELMRRLERLRDLAKAGIDVSDLVKGLDQYSSAADKAAKIIANFEDYRAEAYWDVNHYRVGFGSDTMTSPSGVISTTTKESVTTLADAIRDLNRRIQDYFVAIERTIGSANWNQLSEAQKGVLASIVHNYGTLPNRIVEALKGGDTGKIADAIRGLGSDNNGINERRRNQEAAIFEGTDQRNDVDFQIKKQDELRRKQDEYNTSLSEHITTLKAEVEGRKESNREGTIAKALAEEEEKARKAGLPLLENGSRLTREQAAALREAVGARYDALHAGEAEKKQRQEEQEAIQRLIGLDQQRKTALQELQQAMAEGDQGRVQELREQVADLNREIAAGIPLALELARALGDEKGIAALSKITFNARQMRLELFSAKQVNNMLADGMANAFGSAAQAIGQAIVGAKSWKDALTAVRDAFLQFAGDFLIQIGQMIIKQMILNALSSAFGGSSGGIGGAIASAANALLRHDGGLVAAGAGASRSVPMAHFANAVRMHTGGIAGLRSDEVPAILRRNEEVLTETSPRNILNGGAAADGGASGGAQEGPRSIKNVMLLDPSELASAMAAAPGERVILSVFKKNIATIKKILGP